MKKKTKIIITSITLAGLLFLHSCNDYKYVPSYSIVENNDNNDYWEARYRYGNIYIIKSKKLIDKIRKISENDIIILDERENVDPNMKVISSHEITDKEARNDILEIIMEYERLFPSKWDRTIESMRLEWFVHNLLYDIDYKRNHTDNVDFDNNDELQYQHPILNKILKV